MTPRQLAKLCRQIVSVNAKYEFAVILWVGIVWIRSSLQFGWTLRRTRGSKTWPKKIHCFLTDVWALSQVFLRPMKIEKRQIWHILAFKAPNWQSNFMESSPSTRQQNSLGLMPQLTFLADCYFITKHTLAYSWACMKHRTLMEAESMMLTLPKRPILTLTLQWTQMPFTSCSFSNSCLFPLTKKQTMKQRQLTRCRGRYWALDFTVR